MTTASRLFDKELGVYIKQRDMYKCNKSKMFTDVIGWCTEVMKSKIVSNNAYKDVVQDPDMIRPLVIIRLSAFHFKSVKYPFVAAFQTLKLFGNT
eukprot:1792043-Ditylum_brightwellii.AAC.1